MIYNVKISAITPVHIGSGEKLPMNIEVLYDGENIGVVSPEKIIDNIGVDNISKWTKAIEREDNIWEFLKTFGVSGLKDVSKRTFEVWGSNIAKKKDVKEQLFTVRGYPLLPGSSIKGAVRTAVLSWLIEKNNSIAKEVLSNYKKRTPSARWKLRDFQTLERIISNKYFNGTDKPNANKDIFRFLQITDAEFEYGTIGTNVKILNLQRNGWDFKNRGDQIVEAIGAGSETDIRIKINNELLKNNIENNTISKRVDVSFLSSVEDIFQIVNQHTEDLLNREIDMWETELDETSLSNEVTEPLNDYVDNLRELRDDLNELDGKKEAILRIGGNTGWDFITGAWIKNNSDLLSDDEWEKLYKQLNKGRDVDIFPKTRKIDEDGDLFGFVKLELK